MRKESEEDDFVFVDKQEIPSNKQLVFAADRDNPRKRSYSHNPQPRPKYNNYCLLYRDSE